MMKFVEHMQDDDIARPVTQIDFKETSQLFSHELLNKWRERPNFEGFRIHRQRLIAYYEEDTLFDFRQYGMLVGYLYGPTVNAAMQFLDNWNTDHEIRNSPGEAYIAFKVYWRSGQITVVRGIDIADAFRRAGYGGGVIGSVDFYTADKPIEYEWNSEKKEWVKIPETNEESS